MISNFTMTYDEWSKFCHTYFDTFLSQCKIYYRKLFCHKTFTVTIIIVTKKIITFVSVMKLLCNSASNAF